MSNNDVVDPKPEPVSKNENDDKKNEVSTNDEVKGKEEAENEVVGSTQPTVSENDAAVVANSEVVGDVICEKPKEESSESGSAVLLDLSNKHQTHPPTSNTTQQQQQQPWLSLIPLLSVTDANDLEPLTTCYMTKSPCHIYASTTRPDKETIASTSMSVESTPLGTRAVLEVPSKSSKKVAIKINGEVLSRGDSCFLVHGDELQILKQNGTSKSFLIMLDSKAMDAIVAKDMSPSRKKKKPSGGNSLLKRQKMVGPASPRSQLSLTSPTESVIDTPVAQKLIHCDRCGYQNQAHPEKCFCTECGFQLRQHQHQPQRQSLQCGSNGHNVDNCYLRTTPPDGQAPLFNVPPPTSFEGNQHPMKMFSFKPQCPGCGNQQVHPQSSFCSECGWNLHQIRCSCGSPVARGNRFCVNCTEDRKPKRIPLPLPSPPASLRPIASTPTVQKQVVHCSRCGSQNQPHPEKYFCSECGFQIQQQQQQPRPPTYQRQCAYCGFSSSSNTRFCEGCGKAAATSEALRASSPEKKHKRPRLPLVGVPMTFEKRLAISGSGIGSPRSRTPPLKIPKSEANNGSARDAFPPQDPPSAELLKQITNEIMNSACSPTENITVLNEDHFPYYVRDSDKDALTSAISLCISEHQSLDCFRNQSKAILLSTESPAEIHAELLVKGVAKELGAVFLAFDAGILRTGVCMPQFFGAQEKIEDEDNVEFYPPRVQPVVGDKNTFSPGDPVICSLPTTNRFNKKLSRGVVRLTFPDNPKCKVVGVEFPTPIPNGTELGGEYPSGRMRLVPSTDLQPDTSPHTNLPLLGLCDVVKAFQPLVVFIRPCTIDSILEDELWTTTLRDLIQKSETEKRRICFVTAASFVDSPPGHHRPRRGKTAKLVAEILTALIKRPGVKNSKREVPSSSPVNVQKKPFECQCPWSRLKNLFPTKVAMKTLPEAKASTKIKPPVMSAWKHRQQTDSGFMIACINISGLHYVMHQNFIKCAELTRTRDVLQHHLRSPNGLSEGYSQTLMKELSTFGPLVTMIRLTSHELQSVTSWALANHIKTTSVVKSNIPDTNYPHSDGLNLEITKSDLLEGIRLLGKTRPKESEDPKMKLAAAAPSSEQLSNDGESDHETRLLQSVVPSGSVNVHWSDIGSLTKVKETIQEVVLQPLLRPGLFSRSTLTAPSKGILLFGPPGTGKTMIAKAVATTVKASFLSITASTITSKWVGQGEKYAAAVFTLAAKIAPCIIFIDEIDSILGKRGGKYEHESSRKIKTELMASWDGLQSHDQIVVIGATNRPQDLDEAILRRLPKRLLVDLPDKSCREDILKVLLKNENLCSTVDLPLVAQRTQGFSGSDLKSLCTVAAYRPIKRFMEENPLPAHPDSDDEDPFITRERNNLQQLEDAKVTLPSIAQSDFEAALKIVTPTVSEDALSVEELRRWNATYGEETNRRTQSLPYFM